jgi:hypothetical protein
MIIFASENKWLAFQEDAVTQVAAFPVLKEPAAVVWHPQGEVTGVAALEGNVRHAAALIERRLRSEGSVEGEVKVFIHHIRQIGKGYQALYVAAPLGEWQRLLAWANAQPHHCLLLSCPALLWKMQKPGLATVFHHGTKMTFLGMLGGGIVQLDTIAFGDSNEDLQFAAARLGELVREEASRLQLDKRALQLEVLWLTACHCEPAGVSAGLGAAFAVSSGMGVKPQNERFRDTDANTSVLSAIPMLARHGGAGLALNSSASKGLFLADRFLPACIAASFVFALGLSLLSASWLAQQRQNSRQLAALQEREIQIQSRAASLEASQKMPPSFSEQMAFIDTMRNLASGHDPAGLLQAIKAASGEGIRILGVRTESAPVGKSAPPGANVESLVRQNAGSAVVDGVLADGAALQGSKLLSAFIRALRERGYQAEPIDTKGSTAGSSISSRLFSYRLTRTAEPPEARP